MELTAMRKEIKSKLIVAPEWNVRVLVGRSESDAFDAVFSIRIATGTECEASLEALDKLMDPEGGIKGMLDGTTEWETFSDLSIVRCSGHTMFPAAAGPPFVGAEWTVKVMA